MKINHSVHAVLGVHIPVAVETGLKAIAAREGESMATIVRAALRQTVARGGIDGLALFAAEGPAQHNDRNRAVA